MARLPIHVQAHVFSFLDLRGHARAARVCVSWRDAAKAPSSFPTTLHWFSGDKCWQSLVMAMSSHTRRLEMHGNIEKERAQEMLVRLTGLESLVYHGYREWFHVALCTLAARVCTFQFTHAIDSPDLPAFAERLHTLIVPFGLLASSRMHGGVPCSTEPLDLRTPFPELRHLVFLRPHLVRSFSGNILWPRLLESVRVDSYTQSESTTRYESKSITRHAILNSLMRDSSTWTSLDVRGLDLLARSYWPRLAPEERFTTLILRPGDAWQTHTQANGRPKRNPMGMIISARILDGAWTWRDDDAKLRTTVRHWHQLLHDRCQPRSSILVKTLKIAIRLGYVLRPPGPTSSYVLRGIRENHADLCESCTACWP